MCADCGEELKFKGYRDVKKTSLLGRVSVGRPYYHNKNCQCDGSAVRPTDALNRRKMTKGAMEAVAMAGVVDPFGEVAERLLPTLTGLKVSASTVQRTTEAVGEALGRLQKQGDGVGPEVCWDWYQDVAGVRCAYISCDATGIRRQGPNASKAEGRMVHLGMIFNPPPADWEGKRPPMESRRVSSLTKLAGLERPLRMAARRVGLKRAERLIVLSDGGSGLQELIQRVVDDPEFSHLRTVFILDFFHACEHLVEFANVRADLQPNVDKWRHVLRHEGGEALISELRTADFGDAAEVATALDQLLHYLESNRHRMDYPYYRRMGWWIGSGAIESACKDVGSRMKGSGMRWALPGSSTMPRVRAMFSSDSEFWNAFWMDFDP